MKKEHYFETLYTNDPTDNWDVYADISIRSKKNANFYKEFAALKYNILEKKLYTNFYIDSDIKVDFDNMMSELKKASDNMKERYKNIVRLKFDELLKKMVEKKVINIQEPNNIASIQEIREYIGLEKIPKSYNIFLKEIGSGSTPSYDFYGTGFFKKRPDVIYHTELEKKSYNESNTTSPIFKYIIILNDVHDDGVVYYMNLDKCNKKTTECEIQAWDTKHPPEKQPEELRKEKYQSFEEFFREMNLLIVDAIERGGDISNDYLVEAEKDFEKIKKMRDDDKNKTFFKKLLGG